MKKTVRGDYCGLGAANGLGALRRLALGDKPVLDSIWELAWRLGIVPNAEGQNFEGIAVVLTAGSAFAQNPPANSGPNMFTCAGRRG